MSWQGRIERSLVAALVIMVVASFLLTLIDSVQISVKNRLYRQVLKELINTDYTDRNLRDPTYLEMEEFLARDRTDSNGDDSYICGNFANDVKKNALKEGIRCAGVIIRFGNEKIFGAEERGHALVAFETTDRGVIFIEPQKDKEVKVALGVRYFRDNGLREWITEDFDDVIIVWVSDDFDDTITEIEIYWPK